jgi:hypothetical protein
MKAHLSPSNFSKIMTTSRGGKGFGQTALTYADEIILDILQVERYQITAKSLTHGIENEILAKDAYQQLTMNTIIDVHEPIMHQKFNFIGGTPDGLIGYDGIIEIKCPWNPINHLNNYYCNNIQVFDMPDSDSYLHDYWWQVQGYLWITERYECDFVTYDSRFPEHLSLIITRVMRNDEDIKKLSDRCQEFWHEIIQKKLTMFV